MAISPVAEQIRQYLTVLQPASSNWGAILLRLGMLLVILLIILYFLQNRIIYQPSNYSIGEAENLARQHGLILWGGTAAETYRGFIDAADFSGTAPRGTVLLLHGNAGSAAGRAEYRDCFRPYGLRVILLEYPGYGARPGSPDEALLIEDASRSVREARQEFGGPVFLAGESLGAGVAAGVAGHDPRMLDGLLLITPWDDLPSVAQSVYWFLPVRWLVRDRYDSVRYLQKYQGPTGVIAAGRDEIIPERCSSRLYESLGGDKRRWIIPRAGHNNWLWKVDSPWWDEVISFWTGQSGSGKTVAAAGSLLPEKSCQAGL